MEGISLNQQVVPSPTLIGFRDTDRASIPEEPNLRHPVVGRAHPLVGDVIVREEALVFVGPGQFQAT